MRLRSTRLSLTAFALFAVCAVLTGLDGMRCWQERQAALTETRNQAAALADSLAQQAAAVVRDADSVLLGMRERIETDGTGPAAVARVQRMTRTWAETLPVLQGYYVFDSLGRWLVNPRAGEVGAYSVADRPYFLTHRAQPSRDLAIGLPTLSRATGRWTLTLSRRLDHPDGSFAGIVMAAVDVEALQALYGSLHLGRQAVVAVIRGDGHLLLRYPPAAARLAVAGPNLRAVRMAPGPGGTLDVRSDTDGIRRLVGYRQVAPYPMTIFVGLGRDAVIAAWWRSSVAQCVAGLILAMLSAGLGTLLLRTARREQAARRDAAALAAEYQMLADHTSDLILRVRDGGQRVYASPACLPMLGYTPAEMLQRRSREDVHPDDLQRLGPKWAIALGATTAVTCTYRMQRRDGRTIWVEATSRGLPGAAGEKRENLVVIRDVSERQAAALQLQEANRLLLRAEAMTQLGHWRYDLRTRALFCSAELFSIVGWPADHLPTPRTALATYHPEDRLAAAARLRDTLDSGEPSVSRLRVRRPDGSIRHVVTHAEAEHGEDGRVASLVGTLQDVTESRELEVRLQRTERLRAIGQLAAGVAHDFNNLLQVISGNLELMTDQLTAGSSLHDAARTALGSAERAGELTHQLLSFARKQMLAPRDVEVSAVLDDTRELLTRTLGPHIAVQTTTSVGLPHLFVDPEHLQTALVNLAVNAGQAMPGGGRLRIDASFARDAIAQESRVVIAVSDTGCGMDSATLRRATEPFFTTRGPQGTGLGLSMVQGFAQQSGGDLRLWSQPGQGTCAEILLPPYLPASPETTAVPGDGARAGAGRVLLVDDVPEVVLTTAALLRQRGVEVTTAASGAAALALLAAGARFDAMVTDYAMPVTNGLDLVALVREIQPGLPALIVTGLAEAHCIQGTPGVTFLRKPFRRAQLTNAVLGLLTDRERRANAGVATPPFAAAPPPV